MSESSKRAILQRLRSSTIASVPLPEVLKGDWIRYDDPILQLGKMIESVGGSFEMARDAKEVWSRLQSFPEIKSCKRLLSTVNGIPNQVDLESVVRPHDLEDLDFMVVQGELAVAENGAVWVTDDRIKHRVAYFINQHLVILIQRERVVHNMHEAYAQLQLLPRRFGCFLSGPSKTADIEQSLVIGAHGCRSLQMYVIDH